MCSVSSFFRTNVSIALCLEAFAKTAGRIVFGRGETIRLAATRLENQTEMAASP